MLTLAVQDGLSLLSWQTDTFAYADSFDEAVGRYRGLRCGQQVAVSLDSGVLVRPEVAASQQRAETKPVGPLAEVERARRPRMAGSQAVARSRRNRRGALPKDFMGRSCLTRRASAAMPAGLPMR